MRGLPGSGKTHIARNIKSTETEQGFEAPRILALDDYFECDGKVIKILHHSIIPYKSP